MNHQQIAHSARFTYSSKDASHTIMAVLAEYSELRDVRTHIHVGGWGMLHRRQCRRPVVDAVRAARPLYDRGKASGLSHEDVALELTVDDICAMNSALADEPFGAMSIYLDRSRVRMLARRSTTGSHDTAARAAIDGKARRRYRNGGGRKSRSTRLLFRSGEFVVIRFSARISVRPCKALIDPSR